ncbi:MAG TPA: hypothetical protein EYQ44_10790 [Porticoccaceae bacterium]|nr:hypothetical protein [Porticoccaceae bacterium]
MKQKEIFLQSEADAWFVRNQEGVAARKLPDDDTLLREIIKIQTPRGGGRCLKLAAGMVPDLLGLKII